MANDSPDWLTAQSVSVIIPIQLTERHTEKGRTRERQREGEARQCVVWSIMRTADTFVLILQYDNHHLASNTSRQCLLIATTAAIMSMIRAA